MVKRYTVLPRLMWWIGTDLVARVLHQVSVASSLFMFTKSQTSATISGHAVASLLRLRHSLSKGSWVNQVCGRSATQSPKKASTTLKIWRRSSRAPRRVDRLGLRKSCREQLAHPCAHRLRQLSRWAMPARCNCRTIRRSFQSMMTMVRLSPFS